MPAFISTDPNAPSTSGSMIVTDQQAHPGHEVEYNGHIYVVEKVLREKSIHPRLRDVFVRRKG